MKIYEPAEDSFLLSNVLEKEIPKLIKKNKNLKFLEIGCGSGMQLKTVLESGINKKNIFCVDINPKAVSYCKKLGFNSVVSDLFEKVKGKYDLIAFNPPYLPEDKREPEDSKTATTGGRSGSEITNKFLRQAKKHLNKNGKIFLITSSLTKGIKSEGYNKKTLAKESLFFEKLFVLELTIVD